MRSWVFRNRARLEALCGRAGPRPAAAGAPRGEATRPAPGTLVHEEPRSSRRRGPRVVVLVPARRRP